MYKKNFLITGGCGFIGSHFINYIFNKYPQNNIICFDAMYYCASLDNIDASIRTSERFTMINGNLKEYSLICDTINKYNITHIIHFAAQSHVDTSFSNSLQYTYDNVVGTHNLLEAIRTINNEIILLHFSTDEVYGESLQCTKIQKTEQSLLCPTNPYAASKAAAEMYVMSYIHSFKLKAIITRGNNVYGSNQYPEKLIPRFIQQLTNGIKCTIQGNGSAIRNFIHVYDVCTATDIVLNKGNYGEIYNIGSDAWNEFSVIDVAKILIKKIHNTDNIIQYIEYIEDRPFNDMRYFISNDKITALGW